MDPMEQIKATFFQECQELLADLESGLLVLQSGEGDAETINGIFRAVHSVKGGAGAFGMEALVQFAHVFETALEEARSGRLSLDDNAIALLLRAADLLSDHVSAAQGAPAVDEVRSAGLAAELEALTRGGPPPPAIAVPSPVAAVADDTHLADLGDFKPLTVSLDLPDLAPPLPQPSHWTVIFTPLAAMYAKANDVVPLLRELERLGPCVTQLDASRVPDVEVIDPEAACLTFTIELRAACSRTDVEEIFEFVEGDCELSIVENAAEETSPAEMVDVEALLAQARAPAPPPPEGAVQAIIDTVLPPVPVAAPVEAAKTAHFESVVPAPQSTIRVDLERVDRLINLVGELVINQAMLAQRASESGFVRSSSFAMGLDELEQLTREIQDSVMAIRAQPVNSVFQRMPRLAREVAAATGKQVRLTMEGEGTEVDKTVIERLSDPITHMIRNAIDHGLESPAARIAAGKSAEGVVRLTAAHKSGRIVIEVADDGRGIDRDRVRQISVDKGLIEADTVLSDEDVDNLLFLPGFSTASEVSDISGRGVGMDVVKRSIQALGGRIAITSNPGRGSTFTMSLPLTLAVLDGMVVSVGAQTLVTPLSSIIETLQPRSADVRILGPSSRVIAVRDAFVPLIDIGSVLGLNAPVADPCAGVCLLVEGEGGSRAALLVDGIQGQRQVVIKSLEANYQAVPGIAAATILGDGRVALILDVDAVIALRGRLTAAQLPLAS